MFVPQYDGSGGAPHERGARAMAIRRAPHRQ
jgi:hypothetical protein